MATNGHLGYTTMAITSQPVCRSTWCLVLGWGFRLSLDIYHRAFIHALLSRVTLASAGLSCVNFVSEARAKGWTTIRRKNVVSQSAHTGQWYEWSIICWYAFVTPQNYIRLVHIEGDVYGARRVTNAVVYFWEVVWNQYKLRYNCCMYTNSRTRTTQFVNEIR